MSDLPTPTATRLQRPSWKDWRLLVGVLLVLVAVVGGARLVAAADDTVPVYAAAHELVPGDPVDTDDLTVVQVRLDDLTAAYAGAAAPVADDTFAVRPVRDGELVPSSALGTQDAVHVKTLTLPVDPTSAAVLVRGSVVDVWVNAKQPAGGTTAYGEPKQALAAAVVARVPQQRSMLGSSATSIQLKVPQDQVRGLIASVDRGAKITLVPVAGSPLREES